MCQDEANTKTKTDVGSIANIIFCLFWFFVLAYEQSMFIGQDEKETEAKGSPCRPMNPEQSRTNQNFCFRFGKLENSLA